MAKFARRTGLTSSRPPLRYLWMDAYAVCNYLTLWRVTSDTIHLETAHRLIDQVHETLGTFHPIDARKGWLSGLDEAEAQRHPTRGGLRIGKPFLERSEEEPFDAAKEWDRDGQYFHYLTKWMHALDQAARATRLPRYNRWARELAAVAYRAFLQTPVDDTPPTLAWKMSVDLSRPLVASAGMHDPLDGYITCLQLGSTAAAFGLVEPDIDQTDLELTQAQAGLASMIRAGSLATVDPLGIGGLLCDARRVDQLMEWNSSLSHDLLPVLLQAAFAGLEAYMGRNDLDRRAEVRLAFRELGLAIGLHALANIQVAESSPASARNRTVRRLLAALRPFESLRPAIETFWQAPANQRAESWTSHQDINEVMLASCLLPDGVNTLTPIR